MSRAVRLVSKGSLPLRSARMSVLGGTLRRADLSFPLVLGFPGDGECRRTWAIFWGRAAIERALSAAQVNAINDDLVVRVLPDGGFQLFERAPAVNPYRGRTAQRRNWFLKAVLPAAREGPALPALSRQAPAVPGHWLVSSLTPRHPPGARLPTGSGNGAGMPGSGGRPRCRITKAWR